MNAQTKRKPIRKKSLFKEMFSLNSKSDRYLYLAVAILVFLGAIMVTSAFGNIYVRYGAGQFAFNIVRVVGFIGLGVPLMLMLNKHFDRRRYDRLINIVSVTILIMMVATLFFPEVNGARAWIRIGPMTLQPVEFLKVMMILQFAKYFSNEKLLTMSKLDVLLKPVIAFVMMAGFIIGAQNDLGNFLIISMIALVLCMMVPDPRFRIPKLVVAFLIFIGVIVLYVGGPYFADIIYDLEPGTTGRLQLLRIAVLFDPLRDVFNSGFQVTNALVALSSAGLFGSGLNTSMAKTILPEPYNDAIIAVITEEFGLIGVSVLFGLYAFIIYRLMMYADRTKSHYDRLILVGVATFFMAQFFVNIGGMVGLIPMTGVTLLFVSSGGSSIMMAFASIGIAQGIIRKYKR